MTGQDFYIARPLGRGGNVDHAVREGADHLVCGRLISRKGLSREDQRRSVRVLTTHSPVRDEIIHDITCARCIARVREARR